MEAKRVLKWGDYYGQPELDTKIATYRVEKDGGKFRSVRIRWFDTMDDAEDVGGLFDTSDAAMDACEQDYAALCTEFLHLYNPATHVVVSREAGAELDKCAVYYLYDDKGHADDDPKLVVARR
jgi:hypothetical protein